MRQLARRDLGGRLRGERRAVRRTAVGLKISLGSIDSAVAKIMICIMLNDSSSEGSAKSGFGVKTYDSLITGTKLGKGIVPGDAVGRKARRQVTRKVRLRRK